MGIFDRQKEPQSPPEPVRMQPTTVSPPPPPVIQPVSTKPDWAKYSIPDLRNFLGEIESEIDTRQEREKAQVLEKMRDLASSIGLSMDDLFNRQKKPTGRSVVKAKYKHPSGQTWSGRGKPPKAFQEWKDSGKDIEELAIK